MMIYKNYIGSLRFAFALILIVNGQMYAENSPSSICDNGAYRNFCLKAVNNSKTFTNFRRHPIYIDALEHVSYF